MSLTRECECRHRADEGYIEFVGLKSVYELGGARELSERYIQSLFLEVAFLGSYEREQMRRRVEIANVDVCLFRLAESSRCVVSAAVGRLRAAVLGAVLAAVVRSVVCVGYRSRARLGAALCSGIEGAAACEQRKRCEYSYYSFPVIHDYHLSHFILNKWVLIRFSDIAFAPNW